MPDYQLGKIYIITSEKHKLIYVGSTAKKNISSRMSGHIKDYKYGKCCQSIKLLECDDYEYKLLKDFPCNNVQELRREEGLCILHYKNQTDYECVNKLVAGRTRKEYYDDNQNKIVEHKKQYRKNNKEIVSKSLKKYREKNIDKIEEQRKQYRENNIDKIKEQRKKWYEANKDKILAQQKECYERNKDKIKEQRKKWYENNKDKILKQKKEYYKKKIK